MGPERKGTTCGTLAQEIVTGIFNYKSDVVLTGKVDTGLDIGVIGYLKR